MVAEVKDAGEGRGANHPKWILHRIAGENNKSLTVFPASIAKEKKEDGPLGRERKVIEQNIQGSG